MLECYLELEMSCYLAVIYVNLTGKSHPVDLLNKSLLLLLLLFISTSQSSFLLYKSAAGNY